MRGPAAPPCRNGCVATGEKRCRAEEAAAVTGRYFETRAWCAKQTGGLRSQPAADRQALVSLGAEKTIMHRDEYRETSGNLCIGCYYSVLIMGERAVKVC
jgi:hypothetical protein